MEESSVSRMCPINITHAKAHRVLRKCKVWDSLAQRDFSTLEQRRRGLKEAAPLRNSSPLSPVRT
jgi:hypothetical protein